MDLLDRLHHRLRTAMRDGGPGTAAPTVGDVYQRLIPYRAVRGELGIMELADYEHALLRLLAGERGYLELGEERARAEFVAELSSPNPILGVYRDYAGAVVRVAGQADPAPDAPADEVEASPFSATDELPALPGSISAEAWAPPADSAEPGAPQPSGFVQHDPPQDSDPAGEHTPPFAGPDPNAPHLSAADDASGSVSASPSSSSAAGVEAPQKRCVHCASGLPSVADLRFCPECGGDQRDTDCAGCGSSLRAEWRFCIRCGTPRPGVTPRS